jgi:hypothetical protein
MITVDLNESHLLREAMSCTSQRNPGTRASLGMDQEIASLLTAIEKEQLPDRLIKLAIELQNALIEKRRRETTN